MHVQDAAAFRMRQRPDAVLGRVAGELGRRPPAAAEDDERDQLRQRDERPGTLAILGAYEADRARRQPRSFERRSQDVVDEHGDRSERRSAGAENRRVQALQELAGDVEGDVRPRLEVRADDSDRHTPLLEAKPVVERPLRHVARERLERGRDRHLLGHRLDAAVVEPEAVEHADVEPSGRRLHVLGVGGEDVAPALPDEPGRAGESL